MDGLRPKSPAGRYALAVAAALLAIGGRRLLTPVIGHDQPFATAYLAVLASAELAGMGPTVLATVLGGLAGLTLILPETSDPARIATQLALYLLVSAAIALLVDGLHRARARAEHEITLRTASEQALRESEREFRVMFEMSSIGSEVLDPRERRLLRVNRKLCEILGYEKQELEGRLITQITHPEDRERDGEALSAALREGAEGWFIEKRYVRKDGGIVWAEVTGAILQDRAGGPPRALAAVQDVTARKEAERRLEQRSEELRRANAELSRSNAELEQFASVASHDLQEPLRTMTAFALMLQKRYAGRLDGSADEYLAFISEAASRMQLLVNDLLEYSRVGAGPVEPVPVATGDVVEDVLRGLRDRILESGAAIQVGELPAALSDPTHLSRVFTNLVSNALKFRGNDPPRIVISGRIEGGMCRFEVRDNGIGIEPQDAERVFEMFHRLHPREVYPGTGLGLPICRRIIEHHGGRIWVESSPGQGSCFVFTVPAAPPGSGAAESGPSIDAARGARSAR